MSMLRILTMTTPDSENGLGCRVTLWFAGCSHHCDGCHNQHTWDYNQGRRFLDDDIQEKIYKEVSSEYIKGITLSGGDPLSQPDENLKDLLEFLKKFKQDFPAKDIWIYSGSTYENDIQNPIKKSILEICDVMVDGPFIKELYSPDIAFRGSKNQRIIDLQATKQNKQIIEMNIK